MISTSVIGMVVGIAAIIIAMIFKHIPFTAFLNPAAFSVIILGTVACVLNAFPGRDLKKIGTLFKIIFTENKKQRHLNKIEIIKYMVNFSNLVHKEGLLSLEKEIDDIEDRFLKRGFSMAVDGTDEELIVDVLTTLIIETEERHNENANIFSQAGTYAPTLGVLGAVFGLIAAMTNISDANLMAEAVAAAFIATILGIFTGYVLWNPFANKLRALSKHEMIEKRMMMEGIISIKNGESHYITKNKLLSFLSEKEESLIDDNMSENMKENR